MDDAQSWFITGANRGLGRALTEAALAAGHAVFATVRGEHTLPDHDRLTVHHLDVRDRDDARSAVMTAVEASGRLDVLVNNAGYGLMGAVEEVDEAEARAIIDTDLLGPLWLSQAAVEVMRPRRSGHIVQISTVGAVGTMPTLGLYNAAKWGLEGFSEALAAEVRDLGIRVTLVEPGELDTEWATGSMRFASPSPAYDDLRRTIFGTSEFPAVSDDDTSGGGLSPGDAAATILSVVADPTDARLRVLLGEDAPGQVFAALEARRRDYLEDPRFAELAIAEIRLGERRSDDVDSTVGRH